MKDSDIYKFAMENSDLTQAQIACALGVYEVEVFNAIHRIETQNEINEIDIWLPVEHRHILIPLYLLGASAISSCVYVLVMFVMGIWK